MISFIETEDELPEPFHLEFDPERITKYLNTPTKICPKCNSVNFGRNKICPYNRNGNFCGHKWGN